MIQRMTLMTVAILAFGLQPAPAADGVRLMLCRAGRHAQPGWTMWRVPGARDRGGPHSLHVKSASFAPNGFRVTLGPAKALGMRSAGACRGARAAVIRDSLFARAENPPTVTLDGLPAGQYRLVLWLNDARAYTWPPVDIQVADAKGERTAATGARQTGSADSADAARADLVIHSDGREPVRVRTRIPIKPKTYVFICAMELYPAEHLGRTLDPAPIQGGDPVPLATPLTWRPAPGATGQVVWVGDSPETLRQAAELDGHARQWKGQWRRGATVCWRVDQVFDAGRAVTGAVWRFTVESGHATHPFPPDGSVGLRARVRLRWARAPSATRHAVWAGPCDGRLKCVAKSVDKPSVVLDGLALASSYAWRVDTTLADGGAVRGPVWRFSTEPGAARAPSPATGEADAPPAVTLRWAVPKPGAVFDVHLGDSAETLRLVAKGLKRSTLAVRPGVGAACWWRVTARYGTRRVEGPVWRFRTGGAIPVDDMELHNGVRRIGDTWRDGRADDANGAIVELHESAGRAMRVRFGVGGANESTVTRAIDSPWAEAGVTHLRLRVRGQATNPDARLDVRLTDQQGHEAVAKVAEGDALRDETWREVRIALTRFNGVNLNHVRQLALSVTAKPIGSIRVDDIAVVAERQPPAQGLTLGRLSQIRAAPPTPAGAERPVRELRTDVCVVGGGSGGLGAAIAAARQGADVIVVERMAILGGTSTAAYVNNWEPGPGCAIAEEIYRRLARRRKAVHMDKARYEDTLTRASRGHVQFEIGPFHEVVSNMLRETGCCRVLLRTTFVEAAADRDSRRVAWIRATSADGARYRIRAKAFVDCTGGGFLCQTVGCPAMLGAEPRSRFGEASAPERPEQVLNAPELCYRIRRADAPHPAPPPLEKRKRAGGIAYKLPSGDGFVNTCGGLGAGWELMEHGYEGLRELLKQRVRTHWYWTQKEKRPGFEFHSFAPMPAIRESHRIVGEYVLVEQDLAAGVARQAHPDIVAVADHPMDTHGRGGGLGAVAEPYGIPYRCLVPKGPWRNLLIACRGASFSHLAASSCRLSRTMIALGHAAGLAAAQMASTGAEAAEVDVDAIQQRLHMPPAP